MATARFKAWCSGCAHTPFAFCRAPRAHAPSGRSAHRAPAAALVVVQRRRRVVVRYQRVLFLHKLFHTELMPFDFFCESSLLRKNQRHHSLRTRLGTHHRRHSEKPAAQRKETRKRGGQACVGGRAGPYSRVGVQRESLLPTSGALGWEEGVRCVIGGYTRTHRGGKGGFGGAHQLRQIY